MVSWQHLHISMRVALAELPAPVVPMDVDSGIAAAMDANADALKLNDDATAEIQERMKEATEAQKRVTTENAATDAVRRGEGSQPAR